MKKTIFILFLVVAMMTLAACGAQESAQEPVAPEADQEAEAPAAEEPAPEEPMEEEPAAEAGEPVVVTMVKHETEVLNADFWLNAIDAVLEDLPDNIEIEWSSTADRDAYAKQLAATDQFLDIPFAVTVSDFAEADLLVPFDDAYLEENYILPKAAYVNGKSWAPPVGAQLIPLVLGVKAEQLLGSDGVIDIFAPVTRGEFRIVDGQIMEERDHMSLETVLADIDALPTCEEQLDSFDEETAYVEFIAEYQGKQRQLGDLVYCPSDWYLIPKAIPGWEYGYENAMLIIGMYPERARKFIDFGLGRGLRLAILRARAIREGILPKAIFTGEDLCDQRGPMVSPKFLRQEYFPNLERVFEPLLEVGAKIIWHCDGNYTRLIDDVLATGVNGLQGFQRECDMDLEWIVEKRDRTGDPLLIYGPISVTKTLPHGSPQDVRAEVEWAMSTCRDKASLIFFSSNTLVPDVPLENIQALWDSVLASAW